MQKIRIFLFLYIKNMIFNFFKKYVIDLMKVCGDCFFFVQVLF